MKNYYESDYAKNLKSRNIVYSSSSGDFEITPEQFLCKNPDLTMADYWYWKNLSNEDYHETEKKTKNSTFKNVSINELEETIYVCRKSAEMEYTENIEIRKLADDVRRALEIFLKDDDITDKQKERFIKHFIKGEKVTAIARGDNLAHSAVSKSISKAKKKFINIYMKIKSESTTE